MPTLPLLFAALFVATAQAAVPSFGHNVVPYIPQVSQFFPRVNFMGGTNDFPSHFTSTGTTHQFPCQIPRPANATP